MLFRQLFDPALAQYAYLIGCQQTGEALVIDPERDLDRYVEAAADEGLRITAVAETHIHADFLSGTRDLAEETGATVYLSDEGGADWRYRWPEASDIDVVLLKDGDAFRVGHIEIRAVHSPGHTPEHLAFLVTDHGGGANAPMGLVSGDFVFVGDVGRPDLLETAAGEVGAREPAARALYRSLLEDFLPLDDALQVWPGHGAGSACGKALGAVPQSTVGYEKRFNGALDALGRGEAAFVDFILDGQPEPPLYFARMKRLNRDGVPPLRALAQPTTFPAEGLAGRLAATDAVIVDTRADRSAFMAQHLPSALYAPLGTSFVTTVGSYITDPATHLVLVIDKADAADAVRQLARVGLDRVVGIVTPDGFAAYAEGGGEVDETEEITFDEVAERRNRDGVTVLDVRRQTEYDAGHIPGATHVPHVRLAEHLDTLPKDEALLVHCQSGVRAAVASALLASHGFDVTYVNDGFPQWREIGAIEESEAVA